MIEQLKRHPVPFHPAAEGASTAASKVLSCPDAIGKVLEKVNKLIKEGEQVPLLEKPEAAAPIPHAEPEEDCCVPVQEKKQRPAAPCPECAGSMTHEGGCVICPSCGYSKCG